MSKYADIKKLLTATLTTMSAKLNDAPSDTVLYGRRDGAWSSCSTMVLDMFYPVGTIYETADSTFDPATAWGGTWSLVQGKVLVGSGDTDIGAIGTSGGNKGSFYHTHGSKSLSGRFAVRRYSTSSELLDTILNAGGICSASDTGTTYGTTFDADATDSKGQFVTIDATHEHDAVGDSANTNATISNMPPYEVVNIWKRTA